VDGEEAPLTRRCGLGGEAGQLTAYGGGGPNEGLARAKEPAFLSEASITCEYVGRLRKVVSTTLSHPFMVLDAS
jgi:hypothetical protein